MGEVGGGLSRYHRSRDWRAERELFPDEVVSRRAYNVVWACHIEVGAARSSVPTEVIPRRLSGPRSYIIYYPGWCMRSFRLVGNATVGGCPP